MSQTSEFYKPGETSSALVVNQNVNLFGACTKIKTTERDEFPDIMDEPTEKPVKDGAWWRNLGIGIAATTVLAIAVIFLAPVIATVAVAALAVAAVGTAGVTAYVSWKDAKTGQGRGLGQFAFELFVGGVAGALLGAGTVVFWPVITATVTAASEQAAFLGTYYFGGSALFNSYVLPLIPTIGKVTGFTIFGLNGINIWNDIYGLCTGDNVLLETVFNGNEEVYGAAQIVLEMTTEGMHQMASDSMARKASTGKEANGEEDGAGKASTGSKTSTADMDGDEPEQPNTNNNKVNEEPLLDASTKQGGTYIESGSNFGFTVEEINNLKNTVISEGQMLKDIGLTNDQLGPAIAGAYDRTTGKIYTAINDYDGKVPSELAPIIRERIENMPPEVLDSYIKTKGAGSHAEIYAVNKLLLDNPNAQIGDIAIYVNRTLGTSKPVIEIPFETCPHCRYILEGFNIISNN